MLGYILKDFVLLKKQFRVLLLIMGAYTLYALGLKQLTMLAFIGCFGNIGTALAIFSYEERAGFFKYNCILPISRKRQVLCRYLETLGVSLVIFLFTLAVSAGIRTEETMPQKFLQMLSFACLGLIYISILMPLIYKLGVEKTRFLMLLVFAVPIGIGYGFVKLAGPVRIAAILSSGAVAFIADHLLFFVPMATLVIVVLSYIISVRMEAGREY